MAGDSEEEDAEGDENDGEDDGTSAEVYYRIVSYSCPLDFFEDEPTAGTGYIAWRHFADPDENLNEEGWSNLVASLEERFASGSGKTQHTTEGNHRNERPLASDPAFATCIDKITRLPTEEDYPLWRVRCQVNPIRIILSTNCHTSHLSSHVRKNISFFFYCRRLPHGTSCDPPSQIPLSEVGCIWKRP